MQTERQRAPKVPWLFDEQMEAQWDEFWHHVDEADALLQEEDTSLRDWLRAPQVMYRLWRLKVTIKKLNRMFGRHAASHDA